MYSNQDTDDNSYPHALIGIAGKAGVGKDTFASALMPYLNRVANVLNFGLWDKDSFAAPIKAMLKAGLGLNDKDIRAEAAYGKSYRHLAQTLGTEWGRQLVDYDIWVTSAKRRSSNINVVFTDLRFKNELKFINTYGVSIYLVREHGAGIRESNHISENDINVNDCNIIVHLPNCNLNTEGGRQIHSRFVKDTGKLILQRLEVKLKSRATAGEN